MPPDTTSDSSPLGHCLPPSLESCMKTVNLNSPRCYRLVGPPLRFCSCYCLTKGMYMWTEEITVNSLLSYTGFFPKNTELSKPSILIHEIWLLYIQKVCSWIFTAGEIIWLNSCTAVFSSHTQFNGRQVANLTVHSLMEDKYLSLCWQC